MPYRRLPNTDQARLRALKTAVQRASETDFTEEVLPYRLVREAETCLLQFENQVSQFLTSYDNALSTAKQYRRTVQYTKMYISHFIQVLNLAVQRGEIKKEQKRLYHLDPDSHALPDLSTDENLLRWGQYIIDGEMQRMSQGGIAINCPAINKVKVHYDMFRENQLSQSMKRKSTTRVYADLETLRHDADKIILQIWDCLSAHFADKLPYERLRCCENYGMKFYYRSGEKRLSPETDMEIEKAAKSQMRLEL